MEGDHFHVFLQLIIPGQGLCTTKHVVNWINELSLVHLSSSVQVIQVQTLRPPCWHCPEKVVYKIIFIGFFFNPVKVTYVETRGVLKTKYWCNTLQNLQLRYNNSCDKICSSMRDRGLMKTMLWWYCMWSYNHLYNIRWKSGSMVTAINAAASVGSLKTPLELLVSSAGIKCIYSLVTVC